MATVRLPDGKELEVQHGEKARDVAAKIGPRLLRDAVVAKLNGELIDLDAPVNGGGDFEVVTRGSPEGLYVLRHSTAHAMAQAILELYPGSKLTIGPPIENGFYYDIDVAGRITDEDLPRIEEKMREIAERDLPIECFSVSKAEAERLYEDNPYKLEIIDELEDGDITIYRQGEFFDLCLGPHVPSTGALGAFKLQNIAGAYWRGDENNRMLTRIYGTAWPTEKELKAYLRRLEEARQNDHRKLGRELDLFSVSDEVGPGLILWHPKGAMIRVLIEDFSRQAHLDNGYEWVFSPHIGRAGLWETSGHLGFYQENMYSPMDVEGETYYVKPMNCPFHIQIYKSHMRSYRDLPQRYAEYGTVYRYERSGVLHGLTRVRGFTQDDAHIFCRPDQVEEEISRAFEFSLFILRAFDLSNFTAYLATRPEKYVGDQEDWGRATEALRKAVEAHDVPYRLDEGGGAFYGPKIDLKVNDTLGREWQLSTIQFDFNMAARFGLEYIGEDGQAHRPYMVHRALLGSMERFLGILIEHYGGAFPVWLSPVQAVVIPVADRHLPYARWVKETLSTQGLRVEIDDALMSMQKKIRENARQKVPYLLVVGDREADEGAVNVRKRGEGKAQEALKVEEFAFRMREEVAGRDAYRRR
ncbi:MAG TPA: threonine--tRNA ligase [Rubrobacteraceae bacterium]|nr:threonine--tRNA ligase [Rubrobacteraceae bacterium]